MTQDCENLHESRLKFALNRTGQINTTCWCEAPSTLTASTLMADTSQIRQVPFSRCPAREVLEIGRPDGGTWTMNVKGHL